MQTREIKKLYNGYASLRDIEDLKNTVHCADCLTFMKGIPDKSVDMILADLPYGTTACKWDTIIPFEPLWEQYKRIIKDNGAIVLTASQPFTSALVMSNPDMFKYELIYEKTKPSNFLMGKKQPLKYHENILIFYSKLPNYQPIMEVKNIKNKRSNKPTASFLKNENIGMNNYTDKYQDRLKAGMRDFIYPRSIQKFINSSTEGGLHPTQKPVALFEYLIKTYTNEGDIVLDNVAGSFTTAIASENLKRNWICIEKEKEYCEIGLKRINENREKLGILDKCDIIDIWQ